MLNIGENSLKIKKVREKLKNISDKPGVSIVTVTNKPKYIENIYINYKRINYGIKEFIIILNKNDLKIEEYEQKFSTVKYVKVYQTDENITLGECLNFAVSKASYDYIAKVDDDDYYGANYISDLMNVFLYTDADITGKASHFVYFEALNLLGFKNIKEYQYGNWLAGGTFLIKKAVFSKVKYKNLNLAEDFNFLKDCREKGYKIFCSDSFNYIYMKHKNIEEHTWQVDTNRLLEDCGNLIYTKDYEAYVDI